MNPRPLRVVLVWKGDALEERLFDKPQLITVGAGIYSLKTVLALLPLDRLPRPLQKLIVFFKLAPGAG